MPHTQCYEDITRRCEVCERTLVATEMGVSSRLFRAVLRCVYCDGDAAPYYYELMGRCYVNGHFAASETTWKLQWGCEHGCGWNCRATRIEVSSHFLRIGFKCPLCRGEVTRHYGLDEHGFIDITGRIVPLAYPYNKPKSKNYSEYAAGGDCVTNEISQKTMGG
jgi:hypothetical protein